MRDDINRRRLLKYTAVAGAVGATGCLGPSDDGNGDGSPNFDEFLGGYASGDRPAPEGTSVEDMPALEGTLTVYSGRGRPLVGDLFDYFEAVYDDFTIDPVYGGSADLANQIQVEGQNSPADVFYTVNVGALGALANEGRTVALPDDVLELVRGEFRDPDGEWVGTSGRARTIPYNTEEFTEDEIPDDIFAFPDDERFADSMGWAPTYGSFQDFVTAMRILNGEDETRAWLEGMVENGAQEYPNEQVISNAVADGEIVAGFANHYYIQRVLSGNPNTSLGTAFTDGDAGSLFNVAGATVMDTASDEELASNFVRHLLSAEAQEFFAVRTEEYPLTPGVDPLGELPPIDELNPPELDLTQLADVQPTLQLMRDVGIL
ncbi:MAG: extracellular solute-binding protein [Halobacteriales archaeon]|nr:extracellular solute-binding protein [Halobacteriales archaeon]